VCDESLMIGHLNVGNSLRDINEQEKETNIGSVSDGGSGPWNDDVSLVCIRGSSPW